MEKKLKIHFIGIGGSSMNGLALIMKDRGHEVSGSDAASSPFTEYLKSQGIAVYIGQSKENIKDQDIVVHTAAIPDTNEELQEARRKGIMTIDRATFLGKITNEYKTVVGIAGCHGKTTITSMVGLITQKSIIDPTVHIGGIVPFFSGGGTHVGTDDIFIAEACEYENSYHQFHVTTAVINNIDNDHLNFFGDMDNIVDSFLTFVKGLPKSGLLIANAGDERVRGIAAKAQCKVQTYGIGVDAQWQATNIVHHSTGSMTFVIVKDGNNICECHLNIPGKHNILNALAAIVVCHSLGISAENSCKALEEYMLTKRRFEYYGKMGDVTVIHDYAHHPTEISACISTAQPLPHKQLRAVFQCHTFTRAINHLDDFGVALKNLDEVIVTDIYPARELDEGKIHAKDIVSAINSKGGNAIYIPDFEGVKEYLKDKRNQKDILLAMGAGDIGEKIKLIIDNPLIK